MALKFNRIAFKLLAVCISFALPITVLLFLMIEAKNKDIEFAAMEKLGDRYQRPLELLLKDVSLHRWAALRLANGDSGQKSELSDADKATWTEDEAGRQTDAGWTDAAIPGNTAAG